MRHIVAVADESDLQTIQTSLMLDQCQTVRQHLAGMKQISETVDDRDRRVKGHFLESRLGESPHGNEIDPAAETAGAVRGRLPCSQPHFRKAQKNRAAAELGHPGFKSDARAQARLLENHRHTVMEQKRVRDSLLLFPLEIRSQLEEPLHLLAAKFIEIQQIALAHKSTCWRARTISRIPSPCVISFSVIVNGGAKRKTL